MKPLLSFQLFENSVDDVKKLLDTNIRYDIFVKELKDLLYRDKNLSAYLKKGLEDGSITDDKVHVVHKNLYPTTFVPTQVEFDPERSIVHSLKNPEAAHRIFDSTPVYIKKPVIVFDSKYIIDGHHAWAEAVIIRPFDKIVCLDTSKKGLDPIGILKFMQVAIAATSGEILQKEPNNTLDLFTMTEKQTREFVEEHLVEECREIFAKNGIQNIASHIWKGLKMMRDNNRPINGAIDRKDMPQFDKEMKALDNLEKGEIDVVAPHPNVTLRRD